MTVWQVRHAVTGEIVGEHATKKAAVAQADEMTDAHVAIKAMHEGMSVSFVWLKVVALVSQEDGEEPEADQ